MKLPTLSELLVYENQQVVRHFCHCHPAFSYEQGKELFTDLLGWMWLNAYRQKSNRPTYLFGPLLNLDEIWHSFILHTRDYSNFCHTYFDDYLHHNVELVGFEYELSSEELTEFLNDCFDHLGEGWINRNFTAALSDI